MKIKRWLVILVGAAMVGKSSAITTNLFPAADTFLRSNDADSNFGGNSSLDIGVAKNGVVRNHALLRFDLTGIPTNATITGASLTFTVVVNPTGDANFHLNRVLVDWDENISTWNNRLTSTPWAAGGALAGTDYDSSPATAFTITGGLNSVDGLDVDVQSWVSNPSINRGWILIASGEAAATGKKIASREDPDNTPVLSVDYNLPAPPAAPNLSGLAVNANRFHFSFTAQAGVGYSVDYRDSLTNSGWNLFTNVTAPPSDTTINITNIITTPERYFRVRTP